jgi:hypothetical protein
MTSGRGIWPDDAAATGIEGSDRCSLQRTPDPVPGGGAEDGRAGSNREAESGDSACTRDEIPEEKRR